MNRTYSMRSNRVPTQAEIQNPPPPRASTVGKNKFFGGSSLSTQLRSKTAGAVGPELARKLNTLIKLERGVEKSWELVVNEKRDSASQLSVWGESGDDDISDITDKLGVLIYELAELDDQFIDKYDQYRLTLKSIRNLEASVQPSRDRKQKIADQIAHLRYKSPESTKIAVLEQELVRAEAESLVAEAQLSNITREKLKAGFFYLFDAYKELAEKNALIAGYGKALLELLDVNPVVPGEQRPQYDGYDASRQIIMDCEQALDAWTLDSAVVQPTLSMHYGPEDVYASEGEEGEYEEEVEEDVEEAPEE